MSNFILLLRKDLLEIKRTKKWLIYLLTFSLITIISVVTARLLPELFNLVLSSSGMGEEFEIIPSVSDSYVQFIANIGETGFLLISIMFAATIIKEKQTGTFYLLKTNGVKEHEIILSHFISKLILVTVSYLASILFLIPMNLIIFREYTGLRGVVSLSYLYMVLVFALSLSLFISSVVSKKSAGYALAIGAYFILAIISAFPYIDIYIPIHSMTLASNIITNVDYEINDYLINFAMNIVVNVGLIMGSIFILKKKIDNRK